MVKSDTIEGITYYVSISGSDSNPGTQGQPWRTIQKAANMLVAGDTVYIRGGVYSERVVPQNSGSAGNYITYAAYPGETPVIDGTGVALPVDWRDNGLIQIVGKSYVIINGLTIRNSVRNCINLYRYDEHSHNDYAENIILTGLAIQNCSNVGILARLTRHLLVENTIIDRVDYSSGIGVWDSEDATVDGNAILNAHYYHYKQGAHEEVLTIARVNSFVVKNNTLDYTLPNPWPANDPSYSADRIGIDVKESSQNGRVYGNTVRHMTAVGIYIDAYSAGIGGAPTLNHIDVYQNKVMEGGGITVGAEVAGGIVEYVNIYNNQVLNASVSGILITGGYGNGLRKNIVIYNNTVYGALQSGGNGGAGIYVTTENLGSNDGSSPVIIRNNISNFNFPSGNATVGQIRAGNAAIAAKIDAGNNLVYGPQICSYEYPNCVEVGSRKEAPAQDVFVNPTGGDFHLKTTSPAIDSGGVASVVKDDFDGLPRPQPVGGTYDIGAFESQFIR